MVRESRSRKRANRKDLEKCPRGQRKEAEKKAPHPRKAGNRVRRSARSIKYGRQDQEDEGAGSRFSEASKAYYQESREIMSNFEYDRLYDELLKLNRRQGRCLPEVRPRKSDMKS